MEEEKEEEGGQHLGFGSVAPPLSCCLEQAPPAQEVPTSPPIMIILWKKILMMSDQKCWVRPINFLSEIWEFYSKLIQDESRWTNLASTLNQ